MRRLLSTAVPLTPCLRCGKLGKGSYCERHRPPRVPSPSSLDRPTPTGRRRAKRAAGNRCQDCGCAPTPDNPLEVDAVLPVSEGGDHSPGNVRVRCRRCHRRKTNADATRLRATKRR